jgi:NADH:ubiquinone reductase (H+-translocating)
MDARRARVVLVEATDRLLGPFSDRSQRYARRMLSWRGVDVRLGVGVTRVEADRVHLSDGSVLATRTLVWAAGVMANPLTACLEVPLGRGGRIVVDGDLSIPDRPGAYAVGDIADQRSSEAERGTDATGVPDRPDARLPQLAQVALQGGRHAAEQILADLAGRPHQPFRYRDKGMMATIGRRAAVAELPHGPRLTGFLAWVAWLVLHLVYLMGMRNRASVLVNWAWNYWTWDHGPRVIFAGAGQPSNPPQADLVDPLD